MPYRRNAELPAPVRDALPADALRVWRAAYNSAEQRGEDEASRARIAWAAVKRAGWAKRGDRWVRRNPDVAAAAATVTIRDVELVRAGTWDASTGRVSIAAADLDDVVAAGTDAEVDAAPVKLGHTGAWATLGDSAPALGWVANLRRTGDSVRGDLVDVPARLAAIMPKAFRRRSVELLTNVRTPAGKVYRMALTGLALLGTAPPAVKGLADLLDLYEAPPRPVAAADAGPGDDGVTITVVEGDPPDGERDLIAATAVALAGAVTNGEATQAAADAILDRVYAAAGVPDATIRADEASPGHDDADDPSQGGPMPVDEARIRELLGIEEDADVEATITDLRTRAEQNPPPDPDEEPDDEPAEQPAPQPSPTSADVARRIAAAGAQVADDGTVRLTAGAFADLLGAVEQGRTAAETLDAQARDRALDDAVATGRIAPAERAHFAASYGTRPVAELTAFLGGLTPRFATVELGAANASEDVADEAWDAFTADVFGPELTGGI